MMLCRKTYSFDASGCCAKTSPKATETKETLANAVMAVVKMNNTVVWSKFSLGLLGFILWLWSLRFSEDLQRSVQNIRGAQALPHRIGSSNTQGCARERILRHSIPSHRCSKSESFRSKGFAS
eukprot:5182478-Amphidinium_carterae.1